ncbi:D-alanine--D-alanine ligase family protein [Loigolactobacillus iwatensis]|uniref:D-alanine--D-alanine ligase family protein n=1 Tax=Loigolactobacillus iwatensis TaxID=1267156 RepID=UPI000F7D74D7|nr:D-alanine--D-alanine ligase family protein [Loigolactobacillus iwatensis]
MQIYLIYGGHSAEHGLSIASAFAVTQAIDYQQYSVIPIYISKDGLWLQGPELFAPVRQQLNLQLRQGLTSRLSEEKESIGVPFKFDRFKTADAIIFPLVQGKNGEDGKLQGLLETLHVPYVGDGVLASAVGMDKIASKMIFQQINLPQVPYVAVLKNNWLANSEVILTRAEGSLLYPMYVKPANSGSSVGISQVTNRDELVEAVKVAFRYDQRVLIEQGIEARELEVGLLGNGKIEVTPAGEIMKDGLFFDYSSKFATKRPTLVIPAEIDSKTQQAMQDYAKRAFAIIGGHGLARCDFFLTANGDVFLNEINTVLDLSPDAMFPRLWQAAGMSFAQLVEELLELALEKFRQQPNQKK